MSTATKKTILQDIRTTREGFHAGMIRAENSIERFTNNPKERQYWVGVWSAYEDAYKSLDYLLQQWKEQTT